MSLPELVVFDLDFTLWDCGGTWCDCLSPPFTESIDSVYDSQGRHVHLYPDVLPILDELDNLSLPMAIASRTERPDWAHELVELLGIGERFQFKEIFPGSKVTHFQNLQEASGAGGGRDRDAGPQASQWLTAADQVPRVRNLRGR